MEAISLGAVSLRDPSAGFDNESVTDSDCESNTSSLTWNDVETLQLGEYILE